ncbi:Transposable element Tc3 transposase [Folsomia candida]|uniref:Transposable element Tc3 transposase n=1 Tax=Folsomia candida TaxID=158441 RepID=A0A226DVT0_FOLCA|nr:Transposable element Tc3 transposase [Folsomia candida]
MMSVISRMVGIRVVEHPGNSIVYSAGCVGTLPLNLSLSFDQTAAILGREGPLSRSNITTRSCYNADLAIQGFNLTAVFTPFDKNCPVIGQIVAAEFSKYDAAILTELRGSGEDENKNYGAGQPWPYKIYPCILSNEDGDAITKIIGSPLANEKTMGNKEIFPNERKIVFMQDGAIAHTAKASLSLIKTQVSTVWSKGVWAANGPDLNPLKNQWSILKENVYKEPQPRTREELVKKVQDVWNSISRGTLEKLAQSLKQRVEGMVKVNGKMGSDFINTLYTVRFEDTIPSNIFEKLFDWVGLTGGICILVVAGGIAFLLALYLLACLIPILCLVLEFIFYSPVWVVKMGVATSVKAYPGQEIFENTQKIKKIELVELKFYLNTTAKNEEELRAFLRYAIPGSKVTLIAKVYHGSFSIRGNNLTIMGNDETTIELNAGKNVIVSGSDHKIENIRIVQLEKNAKRNCLRVTGDGHWFRELTLSGGNICLLTSGSNHKFEKMTLSDSNSGYAIMRGSSIVIDNLQLENIKYSGIFISEYSNDNIVSNVTGNNVYRIECYGNRNKFSKVVLKTKGKYEESMVGMILRGGEFNHVEHLIVSCSGALQPSGFNLHIASGKSTAKNCKCDSVWIAGSDVILKNVECVEKIRVDRKSLAATLVNCKAKVLELYGDYQATPTNPEERLYFNNVPITGNRNATMIPIYCMLFNFFCPPGYTGPNYAIPNIAIPNING